MMKPEMTKKRSTPAVPRVTREPAPNEWACSNTTPQAASPRNTWIERNCPKAKPLSSRGLHFLRCEQKANKLQRRAVQKRDAASKRVALGHPQTGRDYQ